MDCAAFDERFIAAVSLDSVLSAQLPPEAHAILSRPDARSTNNVYLETLSRLSIHPIFSSAILSCYEPLFPELVARWPTFASAAQIAAGFGRILPVVPYLVEVAEFLLLSTREEPGFLAIALGLGSDATLEQVCALPTELALENLLSLYRLLCFRRETFLPLVDTTILYHLLQHPHQAVRYVAVRTLAIYLKVADAAQEEMLEKYKVGRRGEKVSGPWEGREVDYGFLMSLEGQRCKEMAAALERSKQDPIPACYSRIISSADLSPMTADLCGVLTPRLRGPPSDNLEIVDTPTTRKNIHSLASALRTSKPILVTGQGGSGKTFLVHQLASAVNALDTLVSIHLSGQTDAKLLIGTYTTADTPGSFEWRPGVLATAVREGRWVLVEDIDKAPTEVLSVLLPLIERGELDIPSRGEKIKAARGFRLITTARTSASNNQDAATVNLLGSRLWVRVNVDMPDVSELQTIVNSRYPLLHAISPSILSTYSAIQKLYREPSFFAISRTSLGRQISPRDLFKWCNRTNALFVSAGVTTGSEAMEDGLYDQMFNEAVDCFAGSLHTQDARRIVVNRIAEELQVPSQRVEMLMTGHIPTFKDSERSLTVGRAKLQKKKQTSSQKRRKTTLGTPKRPFATTNHALRLLEQVGVAVRLAEPVLLVGETGTGKTTVVQQLADILGYNLTAINLSQQTEAGDLLGGYKPVDVRSLAVPLKETFDELFEKTFSLKKNQRFLDVLNKNWSKQQWKRVIILWGQAVTMAENFFATPPKEPEEQPTETGEKKKKRKLDGMDRPALQASWTKFAADLSALERQSSQLSKSFAFSFVEGSLVKAARNGDWVLLDEINLAAADTLESISDLLKDGGGGSILLSEKGDVERIQAHPNFRVFACMNPATDVGKRDLPVGLRSRFTELYVQSPDAEFNNLLAVVKEYIGHLAIGDERVCADVAQLYLDAKQLAEANKLVDGANQKPHFSMRTLTRTLSYVVSIAGVYGLRRSLFEGFCMSFLTLLDRQSEATLIPVIDKYIFGTSKNVRSLLNQIPKQPTDGLEYVQFKHYWMQKGPLEPEDQAHYIITPSVDRNLMNLVRACATRKFPVLIQGPTSAGKTSMIEYLAKKTGHKFVRINNHEHTDLQEYLGTYVSDNDGKLSFLEGVLVDALRKGHWIVLDELNLAPTDVLEALNRLLDDNRELLIPETQEVVRPHKDFMLFATQNPPGLYGGRKNLSRAFRNRFLELHFDDIPESELGEILKRRCQNIAPAYCEKIVKVYKELSLLRQSTRLFEQKNSFATLRDLFRWAQRDANGYQQLAEDGYMLLAERVRKDEEKLAVQKILEKEMRVTIDINQLYTAERCPEYALYQAALQEKKGEVVWTKAMKRLFALVAHALRNNEPVLLVGETGCGKTTVCQMLAEAFSKKLIIVNAHQNTETGDIIGAQRPIRNRSEYQQLLAADLRAVLAQFAPEQGDVSQVELNDLLAVYLSRKDIHNLIPEDVKVRIELNRTRIKALFEWAEGPLIQAMTGADFFLLDEISLADDSVLERLNSVLESGRGILLAEKGPEEGEIVASDGFQFLATMNPGGDYGKKELSPALRNRFTEIWVPSMTDYEDVLQIVRSKLHPGVVRHAQAMVKYAQWFAATYGGGANAATISIRQVLAWARFVNLNHHKGAAFGLLHGAALVFFDGLGANPSAVLTIAAEDLEGEKQKSIAKLSELCGMDLGGLYTSTVVASADEKNMSIGPFSLEKKDGATPDIAFSLEAPTTALNAMRVLRAMQLHKPILLEGSPGVGKTSLITALASASGNPLTRINLSDQTDLMDLFGSDVPVEGGASGEFAWRDAPFLRAMQRGDWVLLDEMNLASQSVLEGLNACLDHRGEVYISELDKTFSCHPSFMVFAAQNPHHQGGGRKGLPASFVNRFTVVYVDTLKMTDLGMIARRLFKGMKEDMVTKLITFVVTLDKQLEQKRSFGAIGGPWEFNLRDTLRWMDMLSSPTGLLAFREPEEFIDIVIRQRFRTAADKAQVDRIFEEVFGYPPKQRHLFYQLNPTSLQIGHAVLPRRSMLQPTPTDGLTILKSQLPVLETLITCITQSTPVILVGSSGSGKSSMIQLLAAAAGAELKQLALNADVDTTDIVGGFEQVDLSRSISTFFHELKEFLRYGVVDAIKNATVLDPGVLALVTFLDDSRLQPTATHLLHLLQHLQALLPSHPAFSSFHTTATRLLQEAKNDTTARFEWVDGLLIKAIEAGHWLVLDNANLCSPSVLDRLNSLTERNGFLVVNEHSMENGEPKLVLPHKGFRLFFTMDQRYGELSRAMRNRCVEVFVDAAPAAEDAAVDADAEGNDFAAVAKEDDDIRKLLARFTGSAPINSQNATFAALEKFVSSTITTTTSTTTPTPTTTPTTPSHTIHAEILQTALEHIPLTLAPMLTRWDSHISNLLLPEQTLLVGEKVRELLMVASDPAVVAVGRAFAVMIRERLRLQEEEEEEFGMGLPTIPTRNTALLPSTYSTHISTYYDLAREILRIIEVEQKVRQKCTTTKFAEMNFLERSAKGVRGSRRLVGNMAATTPAPSAAPSAAAAPTPTPTGQLFAFLQKVAGALEGWLRDSAASVVFGAAGAAGFGSESFVPEASEAFDQVRAIIHLWQDLVTLTSTTTNLNEAIFQVYLTLFDDWIKDSSGALGQEVQKALETFREPLRLTTGLEMERLWNWLKPDVPRSLQGWKQLDKIKAVMNRFDKVAGWDNLQTILSLKISLAEAATALLTDNIDISELVMELEETIVGLERSYRIMAMENGDGEGRVVTTAAAAAATAASSTAATFETVFDLLLKFRMLKDASRAPGSASAANGDKMEMVRMAHFANRATESLIQGKKAFEDIVGDLWTYPKTKDSPRGPAPLLGGVIAKELLKTGHTAKETGIAQLQELEIEIKELSKQFTLQILDVTSDRITQLNSLLYGKLRELVEIHHDCYDAAVYASIISAFDAKSVDGLTYLKSTLAATETAHLKVIIEEHLVPVVEAFLEIANSAPHEKIAVSGAAWVHYAIACMKLYTPNVAFDPAQKSMVSRQRHLARKTEITTRIQAEKQFEIHFTGAETNPTIQVLEQRLSSLGEEPPNSLIARPEPSEMSALQGDIQNVLRVVVDSKPHVRLLESIIKRAENFEAQENLLQTNISQLIERLVKGYPVYQDITMPIVGFLYYLKLGFALAAMIPDIGQANVVNVVNDTEPFLAPYIMQSKRPALPVMLEKEAQMLWLRQYAARANTEGYDLLDEPTRDRIQDVFQGLFRKWKQEVTEEREKMIANSSLYTYKGETVDHDEKEFQKMFPDYENEQGVVEEEKTPEEARLKNHKEVAILIAKCQSALYMAGADVDLSLPSLISDGATLWSKALKDSTTTFTPQQIEDFLPAIFLSLRSTTDWISGSQDKDRGSYDFYTDPNLTEAHRLVATVKPIQKRFSELLQLWPENATLQDVIEHCQQLCAFPASSPIAAFMVKVERLHGTIHEWQGVASKEHSAAPEFDAITQLIISWRRLELTTWPTLFDIEDKRQKENALGWWFFLYESIIANPLELLREDLKNHINQLVHNLVEWISMSPLGEFPHRLQMLRVFAKQLEKLVVQVPDMGLVQQALSAFLVYYQQYLPAAIEGLKKDRKRQEKAVADVVLLASWKDTNITALRESAKRSHHKLYKTVRKYRQLIEASMMGVIAGGMGSEEKAVVTPHATTDAYVDQQAVKRIYEVAVKPWNERPARLRDLEKVVTMIQNVAKVPEDKLDVAGFLDEFSGNIITTVKELQQETPAVFTEEVKERIKHLKTRKRKAFTDALKVLREMGLKHNLAKMQLLKQNNLEKILSSSAMLPGCGKGFDIDGIEYYFVRAVETQTKVRTLKEPSPDLAGNDVSRIVGMMEHLISINLEQRTALSSSLTDFITINKAVEKFTIISDLHTDPILSSDLSIDSFTQVKRKISWLPKLLSFTNTLITIRCQFAAASQESLERVIAEWMLVARDLSSQLDSEQLIHPAIWASNTKLLFCRAVKFLRDIETTASSLISQTPEISFAFKPLVQWCCCASISSAAISSAAMKEDEEKQTGIKQLDTKLQLLADSIFVALQKLKKEQEEYPKDETEMGWLLGYQTTEQKVLRAVYMKSITERIEGVLEEAAGIDFTAALASSASSAASPASPASDISAAVRACFAAYYPVIKEYLNTLQHLLHRSIAANRALAKTTYILSTTGLSLLTKGFCEPASQSDEKGDSGEVEGGTGLGDGEGMKDISKDVKDDEDMNELAQEKNQEEREEEIEDEEDAVDMGEEDMEGEMGDRKEKDGDEDGDQDEEDEDEGVEEEKGDVDDLDPDAVDEKMWDEKGDEEDKEKDGEAKGKQEQGDELEAKKEKDSKKQQDTGEQGDAGDENDEEEEEEEQGAQESEEVKQQEEGEGMDEHVPEVETLELPEDMNLDGGDSEDEKEDGEGDEMPDDDFDMEDEPQQEEGGKDGKEDEKPEEFPELDADATAEAEKEEEGEGEGEEKEDEEMGEENGEGIQDGEEGAEDEEEEEQPEEQPEDTLLTEKPEDNGKDAEEQTAPSDLQGAQGGDDNQDASDQASAQKDQGEESKSEDPQQGQGTEKNDSTQQDQEIGAASTKEDQNQEQQQQQKKQSEEEKAFRKVGDILEKWHKQRKQILDATEDDKDRPQIDDMELDDPEFEHLPDDDTAADTQALGAANEEQAHGLDDSMAIDSGAKEPQEAFEDSVPEDEEAKPAEPIEHKTSEDRSAEDQENPEGSRAGAMIGDRKDGAQRERRQDHQEEMELDIELPDLDEEVSHVAPSIETSLSIRPKEEARELWQKYETATRSLSAGLCEQLRLILEPTQATKMRGDFRTGKRLNMRRIIPYIASSYKKDKIWMRRAKPSKRQYQVILAVDDSKSMAEGASSELALETVALVARALSSLEVGQISVLSFGADTTVVHEFEKPFTSDTGVDAFSRFTFSQQKTDVRKLIETSLSLFQNARNSSSSSAAQSSTELWQLEIIISDGVCEDHNTLQRLVRKAQDQRVMIVFVVVDSVRENSILELDTIRFVDGEIRQERYLDTFPFAYYLVVRDVRELPGVLAGALRQWFAESVEGK